MKRPFPGYNISESSQLMHVLNDVIHKQASCRCNAMVTEEISVLTAKYRHMIIIQTTCTKAEDKVW